MRPLSKTDLRRGRPGLPAPVRKPQTATGAAEEALLLGDTQPVISPPPPLDWESDRSLRKGEIAEGDPKS